MKIRVLKTTMIAGEFRAPGWEGEVSKQVGVELCTSKKAVRVDAAPKGGVMTTQGTKPSEPPKTSEPPKA